MNAFSKYLLLCVGYAVACRASHLLADFSHGVSALWPAEGVGVAGVLLLGPLGLPALWVGSLFANLASENILTSALFASADTVSPWIGYLIYSRYRVGGAAYAQPRNALLFVCCCLAVGLVSATLGTGTLLNLKALPPEQVLEVWWAWLLSDSTGALIVAPLILVWAPRRNDEQERLSRTTMPANALETAAVYGLILVLGWLVYGQTQMQDMQHYPLAFAFTPALTWAAFRFNHRSLISILALGSVIAAVGTLMGYGPFGGHPQPRSLLLLQSYLFVMAATAIIIHAVVTERIQAIGSLQLTQDVAVHSLAFLAETRDNETGDHILRTQAYVRVLANALADHPRFAEFLSPMNIDLLCKAAPLHDIGKVGVPDAILLKPGKLTPEEFEEIKKHAAYGRDALRRARMKLGHNYFIRLAEDVIYCHHERWDGRGYPQGLVGENIPIPGRLMALADVYDALISERVYKPAMSHEQAKHIILSERGRQFDPDVVHAFVRCEHEFYRISHELSGNITGVNANRLPAREPAGETAAYAG